MSPLPAIDQLLAEAIQKRASDLHLQAGQRPDVRIDGDLRLLSEAYPVLSQEALETLLLPLLKDAQREEFLERWELDFSYSIDVGRFRVNYHYQQGELGAAFRHIPNDIPNLADLQAPFAMLDFARLERGLVLVTGPTGSGKSTTLAAMLDIINSERACHILTLEDPVEFVHPRKRALIKQREIGRDTKSFAESLKRALRQDPDVILVGEMRDPETTSIALTAAETGHLVLSTLHTRSAPSTVDRIIDQFPPEQQDQIRTQLAASLAGIVSQTLLPRADGEGRVAAHEVLVVTSAIENIIRKGSSEQLRTPLQTQAEIGMQTMDKSLVYLVQQGFVDLEVARRRSQELHEFDQLVEAYRQGRPVQVPKFVSHHDLVSSIQARRGVGMRPPAAAPVMVAPAAPAPTSAGICPVHQVPLETPLRFDEATGSSYPAGTTHHACVSRSAFEPSAAELEVSEARSMRRAQPAEERILVDAEPQQERPAPPAPATPVVAQPPARQAQPLSPESLRLDEEEAPVAPAFKPPTPEERLRAGQTDEDAPVPMRPRRG